MSQKGGEARPPFGGPAETPLIQIFEIRAKGGVQPHHSLCAFLPAAKSRAWRRAMLPVLLALQCSQLSSPSPNPSPPSPSSSGCADDPTWSAEAGSTFTCSWWAANDPGCTYYASTYGQMDACPSTCGTCATSSPPPGGAQPSPPSSSLCSETCNVRRRRPPNAVGLLTDHRTLLDW